MNNENNENIPPVPPTAPAWPTPQPPKKRTGRTVAIVAASGILGGLVLFGGCAAVLDAAVNDATAKKRHASTAPTDDATPPADDAPADEQPAEDTGDDTAALTDKVEYEDNTAVALSKFSRGVSHAYAAPGNTSYARFDITITNGSDHTIDASSLYVECAYGDDGQQGEQIFDDAFTSPSTHIRPGRTLTIPTACELPKSEHYLQVEVTPNFDSETAVFAGNVK